ncbi:MAG TPA: DUF4232 domain-containing protein [Streptosporangiaceae bacterium]|jgi:hypothetical protein|nr:DUF4232 domain-containing protein [Streptosporangiaceae bacterium]
MRLVPTTLRITGRRVVAIAAAAVAGLAISTAAYAATSSATTSAAAVSIPRCTASDLGVWLAVGQGNGAAGTIYYPLEFTNLSHHTCYLYGYPGVSALDRNGHQLGSPANWGSPRGARIVNLAPGATAHTVLAYHDVVVTTEPGCAPVNSAANLRVYPPGQRSATFAAFSFEACSHAGPIWMSIQEPIIPGVGTIYG